MSDETDAAGSPERPDAPGTPAGAEAESEETHRERVNRELSELLQGLRVALPGVQVLFAFLLTVPFAAGFAKATDFQRDALLVTTVAAAMSSVLFIAPAAQHRMLFRAHDKESLLRRSNLYALFGTIALGVAIVAALVMVLDFLFGRTTAVVVGALLGALLLWAWQVQPLLRRLARSD
jgi:O-antigen/teichoic acid export membrane protein